MRLFITCTLLCILCIPVHADPVTPSAIRVLQGRISGFSEASVVTAALPDGTTLYAWTLSRPQANPLQYAVFNRAGQLVGTIHSLGNCVGAAAKSVAVAGARSQFCIVWEVQRGAQVTLDFLIVNRNDLVVATGPFASSGWHERRPAVGGGGADHFGIAWVRRDPAGQQLAQIWMRRIDEVGIPIDPESRMDIYAPAYGFADAPAVAIWGSGDVWLAYQDGEPGGRNGPDGDGTGLIGIAMNPNWTPLISAALMNGITAGDQLDPIMVTRGGDSALLAYRSLEPGLPERPVGNRLGLRGGNIDPPGFPLAPAHQGVRPVRLHSVDVTQSGDMIVGWTSNYDQATQRRAGVTRLSRDKVVIEDFDVQPGTPSTSPAVAADAWGNLQVAWTDAAGGPDSLSARSFTRNMVVPLIPPVLGLNFSMRLDSPSDVGRIYQLAMSAGRGPLFAGRFRVELAFDALMAWSLSGNPLGTTGFAGQLDVLGQGTATIQLPPDPALRGYRFHVAFATFSPFAGVGIETVSATSSFTLL